MKLISYLYERNRTRRRRYVLERNILGRNVKTGKNRVAFKTPVGKKQKERKKRTTSRILLLRKKRKEKRMWGLYSDDKCTDKSFVSI